MEPRLQRRVQRYGWDKAAGYYEDSWKEQLKPAQDRLMEMADLEPGEQVVETACGTGLITLRAAQAVRPGGRVLATDISNGMIEIASQRAMEEGLENIDFRRLDAEDLGLDEASFDVALSGLGLMYVPDPVQSLREIYRVLKPGGRTTVAIWGERRNCGWADIFPIVDRRVASEVCPMFFQQGTGQTLEGSLKQAGFSDVETDRLSVSLYYSDPEHAVMAAFAGGPVALAYRKFDDKTRLEAHQEYLDSISPYRNGKGYEIPGEFVVARGVRAE